MVWIQSVEACHWLVTASLSASSAARGLPGRRNTDCAHRGRRPVRGWAFVTAHDAHHAPDGGLPDPHGAIVASTGALRLAGGERAEGETLDGVGVLAEGALEFAIGGGPHFDRAVHARGHDEFSIGAEGDGLHGAGVAGEDELGGEALTVILDGEDARGLLRTGGGEALAVRAEGEAGDEVVMRRERAEPFPVRPVEQADLALLARGAATHGEQRAIWGKGERGSHEALQAVQVSRMHGPSHRV